MGILPLKAACASQDSTSPRSISRNRVAAGLSLVPEHRELFATMTVEENLQLARSATQLPPRTRSNGSMRCFRG